MPQSLSRHSAFIHHPPSDPPPSIRPSIPVPIFVFSCSYSYSASPPRPRLSNFYYASRSGPLSPPSYPYLRLAAFLCSIYSVQFLAEDRCVPLYGGANAHLVLVPVPNLIPFPSHPRSTTARVAHRRAPGAPRREPVPARLPAASATAILRPRPGSQPGSVDAAASAAIVQGSSCLRVRALIVLASPTLLLEYPYAHGDLPCIYLLRPALVGCVTEQRHAEARGVMLGVGKLY